MKRYVLFLLCFLGLFLSSCDKMPTDSDLNGRWLLTQIGETALDEPVYWSFQLGLLSICTPQSNHNRKTSESVGRFVEGEGRLSLTALYIHYRDRDEPITDAGVPNLLETVGIRSIHPTYHIEVLSRTTLILVDSEEPTYRLIFKKI